MKNSNEFKNSGSTLHDSQLSMSRNMSPNKSQNLSQTLRSPVRSPIRSPLRATLRSPLPLRTTQNFYTPMTPASPMRYTSPLRQRTQTILNLTSDRDLMINRSFARSPVKDTLTLRNTFNTSLRSTSPRMGLSNLNNFSSGNFNSTNNYISYEEENFIAYLRELLDLENQLERAKCDNIIKADFNVEDAFIIFEVDRRGYLSDLDLKYGLNSLDIFPTQDEINLLVKRFNRNGDGFLR